MSVEKIERGYDAIYEEYRGRREKIKQMGGEKAVRKQHEAKKLTARERLDYFFDDGTFTEIGLFVAHRTTAFGLDKKEIPAEAVIVGFGKVDGRLVMAAAEDYTSMAGTFGENHGKKFSEAIKMAKEKGIPFVGLNDSGGARLQEGMDTLQAYAWLFSNQILASGIIPQIAMILGPCLGGQAYHPIMQDFIIQCRHTGHMAIAGPAFVKTQLGEKISIEDLCGVQAHAVTSGSTCLVAEDDRDALDKARRLLSFLPSNNSEKPPRLEVDANSERTDKDLDTLIPEEPSTPFEIRKVIERIVDNGDFSNCLKISRKTSSSGLPALQGALPVLSPVSPIGWEGSLIVMPLIRSPGSSDFATFSIFPS